MIDISDPPVATEAEAARPAPGLADAAGAFLSPASMIADGIRHSVQGLTSLGRVESAWVTHYGERFNGRTQGCRGYRPYSSQDASIVAIGSERAAEWPCGTILRICGPGGCLVAQRSDSCGGCGPDHVDLSEQGLALVCGADSGVCQASVEAFQAGCRVPSGRDAAAAAHGALALFARLAETALEDRTAGLLDLKQGEVRGASCSVRAPEAPAQAQP